MTWWDVTPHLVKCRDLDAKCSELEEKQHALYEPYKNKSENVRSKLWNEHGVLSGVEHVSIDASSDMNAWSRMSKVKEALAQMDGSENRLNLIEGELDKFPYADLRAEMLGKLEEMETKHARQMEEVRDELTEQQAVNKEVRDELTEQQAVNKEVRDELTEQQAVNKEVRDELTEQQAVNKRQEEQIKEVRDELTEQQAVNKRQEEQIEQMQTKHEQQMEEVQAELQTIRQTLKYPILKRQIIIKLATIVGERFWPSDSCSWPCDDDIHRLRLLFKYMDWATAQVAQDDGFRGRVPQKGCPADTEDFHTLFYKWKPGLQEWAVQAYADVLPRLGNLDDFFNALNSVRSDGNRAAHPTVHEEHALKELPSLIESMELCVRGEATAAPDSQKLLDVLKALNSN
ncbi:uncharacterized protein MONBRDRAFT_26776 [Monosiga brevicollis MX1]|uniref:Uncharacterized protein n=1 Tax=Monosiga brevicollis TaxID=81824 RepID=A9V3C3_MONBE|nr:uncharacterized protein MONBRDRAFT_26776 [Monosiga brevicollis MX1]EDQ88163.1 predicted protein [Monosiga brevicollis MX1]|eukprot:XP_001747239.1 hypothetical protein [Monosiga brevicollis MX1]